MKKLVGLVLLSVITLTGCSGNMLEEPYYYDEYTPTTNNESYEQILENQFINTADMPVSTFSADVDTASYSNVRRFLRDNQLPVADAVRIEEMVNYFTYNLPVPTASETISVYQEMSQAPWNENHQLLMVGLKTQDIVFEDTPGNNLVFLLDVSGSMNNADKLPLLKSAMILLLDQLRGIDKISIVVYAGSSGLVLDGADGADKEMIIEAIESLEAGGSTAGAEGINLAYETALKHYIEGGNNRVILGTDGDFNVGPSSNSALEELIEEKRDTGIYLSVLGFGTGNLQDSKMETLADKGNGVYYYIDSILEAKKVFMSELGASLITVAENVKLQIEFNPVNVKAYRLIGYENRVLNYDDFDNDSVDAGDMGAGHEVIAFYEIIPADSDEEVASIDAAIPEELRYDGTNYTDEIMTLTIRYVRPGNILSEKTERTLYTTDLQTETSETFRFASSVVEFGLLLRNSEYKYNASYDSVTERATSSLGQDEEGYRQEFLTLVEIAKSLDNGGE